MLGQNSKCPVSCCGPWRAHTKRCSNVTIEIINNTRGGIGTEYIIRKRERANEEQIQVPDDKLRRLPRCFIVYKIMRTLTASALFMLREFPSKALFFNVLFDISIIHM